MIRWFKRLMNPRPAWFDHMGTRPVSAVFGLDRGTPIDRYYIERFLDENRIRVTGKVLEIAESTYSKKYGANVASFEVLHVDPAAANATIIGDLTQYELLPEAAVDCFICTQTLNFIYDVKAAVKGIHKILKPGRTALITVACLTQISRYDMDRWGDYWRFTPLSIKKILEEVFGEANIETGYYGNSYAATAIIQGLCKEELDERKLLEKHPDYPVIITIIATKR